MREHHINKGKIMSKYKITDSLYRCECGKEFNKAQSLNAHFAYCLFHKRMCGLPEKIADSKRMLGKNTTAEHLGKEYYAQIKAKSGKTYSQRVKAGQIIPFWLGKHLTNEHKKKCSIATCQYLIKTHGGPRYNKSAIPVLEQIAKEHSWNIQHAENGGEFYTGIGYFVDAYDKEQNVVLEYDEPAHYEDVENNILREKDLKRQNEIIEHFHCEYWRYNEKMKVLWKVT